MQAKTITYEVVNQVARISLCRPEKRNAMNLSMREALWRAVDQAASDASVKAILLRAEGEHFCAGGDIADMNPGALNAESGRERILSGTLGAQRLIELPKPVIAAVDGCAYGAGASLALAADMVIASERLRFSLSFLRIGLIPDLCALYTLPRVVGWARAKALLYSNRELSAQACLDQGLVSEVLAPTQLDDRAMRVAEAMAALPPVAFAMTKAALGKSLSVDLASLCDMEIAGQAISYASGYHAEAAQRALDREPLLFQWPI